MAPINPKKEIIRLVEAKSAIKKMKERRREGKRGDVQRANPTVKALVSASQLSTNSIGLPQDSLVTLRSKPTAGVLKKELAKPVKSKFPSVTNGSQNGLVHNGQQPAQKSKKSSFSPKENKSFSVFASPALFTADSAKGSMVDISGMSMADEDVHYSPYIKPSAVRKVYVNKKKAGSVSEFSSIPGLDCSLPVSRNLVDSCVEDDVQPPVLNVTKKAKNPSTQISNLEEDLFIQKTKKPAVTKHRKKPKKSLSISQNSISIKKLSAPMSIKKTSARVKAPTFFVTADDSSSKSDLKTSQFYGNKQNANSKSGFSVTTVSENKFPVNNDSSDDSESQEDELASLDKFEDVAEEFENDVEEQVPSKPLYNSSVQFHFIEDQVILHLKHPSIFTFCGQVRVKVLKGAVEVLGYLLTPSSGYHTVFSPNGSGLLALQTMPSSKVQPQNKTDDVLYAVGALLKDGKPDDSFLLMEESESILPYFLSRFVDFPLFPRFEDMENEGKLFSKASEKLQCLCDPSEDSPVVQKGELWDEISEDIIENPGCTVLCGGKGVGKSTILRYFINRLLSNGSDEVLVIDFDPGQAEFTIAGCVSLVAVKNPLFGPNFTHLQNPLKCIYIGEVNVTNAVSRFMDACLNVISYWQSDEELRKMPCIVNTMGFTKGIGNTIMVQLLAALQPTRVVQITSQIDDFNYPEILSDEYVKKSCSSSPFSINLDSTMHSQRHSLFSRGTLKFKTHIINSVTDFGDGVHNIKGFLPRRQRETAILSYLSQMVSAPDFSILDVVPYCCPLDTLYLHICHEVVPPAVTLSAFNASLVALCCVNPAEQDVVQLPESGFPSIINKFTITDCLGFGIVRGIDMDTRSLYLLTPVPSNVLKSVNCLVLGAVNLPSSLYFSPPREPGAVPYVIQKEKQPPSTSYSGCLSFN